jgi:hypothetical protein
MVKWFYETVIKKDQKKWGFEAEENGNYFGKTQRIERAQGNVRRAAS